MKAMNKIEDASGHSNGGAGVHSSTRINVRFVAALPLPLLIKHAMKKSVPPPAPSPFQIAVLLENFLPGADWKNHAPGLSQTPFAVLRLPSGKNGGAVTSHSRRRSNEW